MSVSHDGLPPVDEAPRSLERGLSLLVEQVADYAIFLLDPSGHVASWNTGAQRIKGYLAHEIIGQHFSRFYRPKDVWKCQQELEVAARDGRVEDEDWRVRKDGSLFWADVVITCLRDSTGQIVGYGKVTRDLSDRRKAEETLRRSEERFRLLVESVKDYAIFMLDPRGLVTSWNVGAERIKGYRADEVIGQHFSLFYPEEEVRAGECELELAEATRHGRFEDEGWRIKKDGSKFWANVVLAALHDASGALVGFAKVTRDLTERRAAELEKARLGQQARERLEALTQLSEAMAGAISLQDVGQAAVDCGTRLAQADTCSVYLLDEHQPSLRLVAERGPGAAALARDSRISSESPLYGLGRDGSGEIWVESSAPGAAPLPAPPSVDVAGPQAQAFACVPLVAEGRNVGLLGLGFQAARAFSEAEREFIRTFARQCAQGVLRARRLDAERANAALADRLSASLQTTLRSIGDAVIATDAQGTITLMNGVAEKLTGWLERDARGKPLPEVFHIVNEQTRAIVANPVTKVLETGGIVGLANHTVLLSPDGRETPIDDSGAPIRSEDGNIAGVVLVFRDVTDRKLEESRRAFLAEATRTLSESLDYEETVARVAHIAVPRLADWCAVDLMLEGQAAPKRLAVAHVNPAKVKLAKELGAKYPRRADAPNGTLNVLRTGRSEFYPEIPDELLAAVCEDAEHLRLARELQLRSAIIVPLRARDRVLGALTFVYAESGRSYTQQDLALAEDLARRCANAIENARLYRSERQARQAADAANRAKDEFLAVVSHELRTPLNAIMGWSKMLAKPDFDERRKPMAIDTIARNATAMAQLIEDLLDTSRVISGKLSLQPQKLDLVRVIEAVFDSVRPAAASQGVHLASELAASVPSIVGDPSRLQQVIWNLVSNAIKFSQKGGRVDVSLKLAGPAVEVVVADQGQGISAEFLPYVFEPFRQQDASSSRTHGGLGLGLAISRQIVELHGGKISAESPGQRRGATFTVSLPIVASTLESAPRRSAEPAQAATSLDSPAHLRGLHVLVVDDDDDARQLVASVLEDCGCRVSVANSARAALNRLIEDSPEVLLSDVAMPGEDGYELIRKVRSLPRERGGAIPAAALTAYARPEDRRRLLNAGFSIHLPKPIEPAELVAVVSTLSRFVRR